MSTQIQLEPSGRFVVIRVHGRLSVEEATRTLRQVAADHPAVNRLWDFREGDFTAWSAETMRDFISSPAELNPGTKRVAAVVSRDVDFGLGRMYETLAAWKSPIEYQTFREMAEAVEWLTPPASGVVR